MKISIYFVLVLFFSSCLNEEKLDLQDQTLSLALTTEIPSIDPAVAFDEVSINIISNIYETLYEYEYLKRPLTLKPLLAQEFPVIENNGLKYTFKLKKNISYHANENLPKNRKVTSTDLINQIRRLAFIKTKSNGWWLFEGKIKGLNRFRKNARTLNDLLNYPIEGLQTPDDQTLVIELIEPYPQLLYAFALTLTSPIPAEVIKAQANNLIDSTVGTGPYKISSWNRGSKIVLEKHDQYTTSVYPSSGDRYSQNHQLLIDQNKKLPFYPFIEFRVMKESQTRWLEFLKGNLDILSLAKDHYTAAFNKKGKLKKEIKKKNISSQLANTMTFWWLGLNMKDSVLGKNKNLRLAIAHALNRDEFIEIFTQNIGLKANYFVPPAVNGYDPTHKLPFTFNLNKAKDYLKKAGYPEGKGLKTFSIDMRGSHTTARQMAEYFQKSLAAIGVKSTVNLNQFSAFLQKARSGNLEIFLDGWTLDYPDAENVLQLLMKRNFPPGQNHSSFQNPMIEKLYQEYQSKDRIHHDEILMKVQSLLDQELPWILLYYERETILYSNKTLNYRYHPKDNWLKYLKPAPNN